MQILRFVHSTGVTSENIGLSILLGRLSLPCLMHWYFLTDKSTTLRRHFHLLHWSRYRILQKFLSMYVVNHSQIFSVTAGSWRFLQGFEAALSKVVLQQGDQKSGEYGFFTLFQWIFWSTVSASKCKKVYGQARIRSWSAIEMNALFVTLL